MSASHASIRVTGKCCPLPLIELAKAAKNMRPGELLKIIGDDPIFELSVRDYCTAQNLEIISVNKEDASQIEILIRC
jgi:tRNA 2-thiouridine synthesizing protein A